MGLSLIVVPTLHFLFPHLEPISKPPMFIVFEGVDGAGKTTQLTQLVKWLEKRGTSVVTCKDPGSTKLGEELRSILLNSVDTPISMRAEMMLFTTARTQLVDEIVRPALAAGKTCLLYTSPSPRDATLSRMPSSA